MYDTVLVPTDGSDQATTAARHGLALAGAFDATVHVLSVTDMERAAGPFDAGGVEASFRDRLEREADDAIARVTAHAEGLGLETEVRDGRPAPTILEYVESAGIDLVVMGTHGRGGLRRVVLGSVAEAVVRQSTAPVVTVRAPDPEGQPATKPEYDTLLVPTDGSRYANAAVDHAVAVADAVDATVHALGVVDLSVLATQSDITPADVLLERLNERAEAATATVNERGSDAGVDVVTAVREGRPAGAILDYVESAGIDLVAMGTHGRTGVQRFLLGSTTERVVRNAAVPVLTARPPDTN